MGPSPGRWRASLEAHERRQAFLFEALYLKARLRLSLLARWQKVPDARCVSGFRVCSFQSWHCSAVSLPDQIDDRPERLLGASSQLATAVRQTLGFD